MIITDAAQIAKKELMPIFDKIREFKNIKYYNGYIEGNPFIHFCVSYNKHNIREKCKQFNKELLNYLPDKVTDNMSLHIRVNPSVEGGAIRTRLFCMEDKHA